MSLSEICERCARRGTVVWVLLLLLIPLAGCTGGVRAGVSVVHGTNTEPAAPLMVLGVIAVDFGHGTNREHLILAVAEERLGTVIQPTDADSNGSAFVHQTTGGLEYIYLRRKPDSFLESLGTRLGVHAGSRWTDASGRATVVRGLASLQVPIHVIKPAPMVKFSVPRSDRKLLLVDLEFGFGTALGTDANGPELSYTALLVYQTIDREFPIELP